MTSPTARGFAADADDPVVVDTHDARPDDLAGIDVEQTRCFEGQHASDHRLLDEFDVGGAAVEHARLLPHLDGEAHHDDRLPRCTSALASSGIPSSGKRAST